MMNNLLEQVTIKGFKSIRSLESLKLGQLNVLIGQNGVGKSNFIQTFRLLETLQNQSLPNYVMQQGGI